MLRKIEDKFVHMCCIHECQTDIHVLYPWTSFCNFCMLITSSWYLEYFQGEHWTWDLFSTFDHVFKTYDLLSFDLYFHWTLKSMINCISQELPFVSPSLFEYICPFFYWIELVNDKFGLLWMYSLWNFMSLANKTFIGTTFRTTLERVLWVWQVLKFVLKWPIF